MYNELQRYDPDMCEGQYIVLISSWVVWDLPLGQQLKYVEQSYFDRQLNFITISVLATAFRDKTWPVGSLFPYYLVISIKFTSNMYIF